jgi:hypothetical protein
MTPSVLDTEYSIAAPTITGGAGLFRVNYYPPGMIVSSDDIVIQYTHDGSSGRYPLSIQVSLYQRGVFVSDFEINVEVKVRNPVELVAHGFQPDGSFKVSVGNMLPGETFHLQKSTDLITWTALGGADITADGEYPLSLDRTAEPILFLRLAEGPAP